MATPQTYIDPTAGHRLVSTQSQNRAATRYLFFAGNLIDPDRQYQIDYLRYSNGGEEIQSNCMRRSINGFLERGRLTPLEVWTHALPSVLISEGLESETVRIEGPTTPEHLGVRNRPGGLAGVGAPLVHVKFYPGDEIQSILRAHDGKGIVEVRALLDTPWYEDEEETKAGVPQLLNQSFFPTSQPKTLSGLEEQIDKRSGLSDLHGLVARDMLAGCSQFRRWAEARLAAEHVLLRQRVSPNGQHTYTYSPVARLLLEQLEMKPQDTILEQAAGINAEQLQAIIGSVGGQQIDPALIGQIAGAVAQQFLAAQRANQEQPPVVVAEEVQATEGVSVKNKGGRPRKETTGEVAPDATGSEA